MYCPDREVARRGRERLDNALTHSVPVLPLAPITTMGPFTLVLVFVLAIAEEGERVVRKRLVGRATRLRLVWKKDRRVFSTFKFRQF